MKDWTITMEFNPLTTEVRSRREKLDKLRETETELAPKLAWYDAFDPQAMARLVMVEEGNVADLTAQIDNLELSLTDSRNRLDAIRPAARLGWVPSYWFSETRSAALADVAMREAEIKAAEADQRRSNRERTSALAHLADVRESLKRHSQFDRSAVEGALIRLEAEIGQGRAELDGWEARAKALDKELEAPLHKYEELRGQITSLRSDHERAKRFERELSGADNSYQRKQIHDE